MNQTQKLLQSIVENARMGLDACEQLLTRTEDAPMRQELMQEKQQYQDSVREAEAQLYAMNIKPRPKGPAARAGMWLGMQMNTMTDHSPSHIAEIVIQGATMGVVEITKARNANPDASAEAQGVAAALVTAQQEAIDRLKHFLTQTEPAGVKR